MWPSAVATPVSSSRLSLFFRSCSSRCELELKLEPELALELALEALEELEELELEELDGPAELDELASNERLGRLALAAFSSSSLCNLAANSLSSTCDTASASPLKSTLVSNPLAFLAGVFSANGWPAHHSIGFIGSTGRRVSGGAE